MNRSFCQITNIIQTPMTHFSLHQLSAIKWIFKSETEIFGPSQKVAANLSPTIPATLDDSKQRYTQ
jgi:hypothetical protein